jgi:serine/threonine protein kinase
MILNKEIAITASIDIYSLGIIFWELHACKAPFTNMYSSRACLQVARDGFRPTIPAGKSNYHKNIV